MNDPNCKCPDCNISLVPYGPVAPDNALCTKCMTDFSPKYMAKLRTFEGFRYMSSHTIPDDDGTGRLGFVFFHAPYQTPERRMLAFIELTNWAFRFRRECHCSYDCCGCWFENGRELKLFDEDYGIWILQIRENMNV